MTLGTGATPAITDYYYGEGRKDIQHQKIEHPQKAYAPGRFYMKENDRYLELPISTERYICKPCGTETMRPMLGKMQNPSIVQCECEICRLRMFIEVPYQKNAR